MSLLLVVYGIISGGLSCTDTRFPKPTSEKVFTQTCFCTFSFSPVGVRHFGNILVFFLKQLPYNIYGEENTILETKVAHRKTYTVTNS